MEPVTIAVLGEPVGKGRARFSRRSGVAYTPAKTRNYESLLKLAASQEMRDRAPFDQPVEMDLLVVMPIPASWSQRKQQRALTGEILPGTKPDLSNVQKAAEDAFNKVVYRDDSLIVRYGRLEKRYGVQPGVFATVRPL